MSSIGAVTQIALVIGLIDLGEMADIHAGQKEFVGFRIGGRRDNPSRAV